MIRLATVFSGIGAIEHALLKQKVPYEIIFACDNGERNLEKDRLAILKEIKNKNLIDSEIQSYIKQLYDETNKRNFVKDSYFANYKIEEEKWYEDIRFIDGLKYNNNVDLFVGGSPCQSFSNMGKRGGLEDTRGTLFYEFARLVKEIQPKVFIYENVPGMLNHDNGHTWSVIKNVFDELGYKIYWKLLNSKDYGIPQNRKRIYVVGFKENAFKFNFPKKISLPTTMFDYLENEVDPCFYLGEKGFRFVTQNKARARVNENIIRTQKANQQFNWNGDFLFTEKDNISNFSQIKKRAFVGSYQKKIGVIRQLTPRECLRLMGYDDSFKIVVPNVQMYRQSGNSIVVNVFEHIICEIKKTGIFDE